VNRTQARLQRTCFGWPQTGISDTLQSITLGFGSQSLQSIKLGFRSQKGRQVYEKEGNSDKDSEGLFSVVSLCFGDTAEVIF